MNKTPAKLLPVGFYDLLFDEAEKNHQNVNLVLSLFLEASYRLVKTPLVEFEGNFSASGSINSSNSFRTVDVISGQNLVFRNDITPQIARLLATRLKSENLPLKLCYAGDVLCARSDELYADRQQTQVGIEIIGCRKEESDFEIIRLLLSGLKKLALKNLIIEFSLPNFLEIFLKELGCENKDELREAVMKKNLSKIRALACKNSEIISKICLYNNDLENLSQEIFAKISSQQVNEELQKSQKIVEFLKENFPEIAVRFDLFGDHEASYHHGLCFDVFCGDFSYAIARGGRYEIDCGSKFLNSIGATIYMNRLRKA